MNAPRPMIASFDRPRVKAADAGAFLSAPDEELEEVEPEAEIEEDPAALLAGLRPLVSGVDPDQAYVPVDGEPPIATLSDEGGAPIPIDRFYADIVAAAAETMAMLARHRTERRMNERAREEERILQLADAIAASPRWATTLLVWWAGASAAPDPWKLWAPVFTLACLDGDASLATIARALDLLSPGAYRHAEIAAEALAVSPHPDLRRFAEELVASAHPPARAIGVDLLSRVQAISPADLARHMASPSAPIAIRAIRGALRLAAPEPSLFGPLLDAMRSPEPAVAWEAARALALLGQPQPCEEARRDARFAATLGPKLLEIYIALGDASDLPRIEAYLKRAQINAGHLDAVARFGHPRSWAFLLHFLADGDLARDAADALELLFGELTPPEARLNASAWRDAIARGRFDGARRHRAGAPWRPGSLSAECRRGRISRVQCEARIFEIAARAGIRPEVDLSLWSPDADLTLRGFLVQAERADARYDAGSWDTGARR